MNDIICVDSHNSGIIKRLWVGIISLLINRKGTCSIPQDIVESLAAVFFPDIRAFFDSEEGKREFDEWKERQKLIPISGAENKLSESI